jgi:CDP-diacylglycerol--glycerol-3-phosphate 3-phosphatidyltransferase
MLDRRWRARVERGLGPIGGGLGRAGVTPDALTIFGLACSIGTALAVASGHLLLGVTGIVLAGLGDLLDGNLARSSGRTGPRGSFFDSVADRVSDALVLGGVGWYFARESAYLPLLAFAVAALSMLISYERAKAEALGIDARGGLMERAERFVLLGIGMAFDVLVPVLWVMLVLCSVTALHRFGRVWVAAGRPAVSHEARPARSARRLTARRRSNAAPRLREWWETRRPAARAEGARRRHPARRRNARA